MPAAAATAFVMKQLLDHFPDDPVMCDEDGRSVFVPKETNIHQKWMEMLL